MADNNTPTVMTVASASNPQTVDLTKKVKLYAPKNAAYHSEGEQTEVSPLQVAHFKKLGFTDQPPVAATPAQPEAKK